jgi:transcriptional regulator with XRE-family HTH domain
MTEPTGVDEVAARLQLSHRALNLKQRRLCDITGISTAAWNNSETGDNRIGLDNAIMLCQATGLTLDWIYRGIRSGLTLALHEAITAAEAGEKVGTAKNVSKGARVLSVPRSSLE